MYINNSKILAFVVCFIFSMALFTGSVSALNFNHNTGTDVQTINNNFLIDNNLQGYLDYNGKNLLINEITIKNKNYKNSKDHQHNQLFKKQKQGMDNLRTLSSGGIPPKGLDEIVADNIKHIKSLKNTVKSKIYPNFSIFHKKIR